jgi:hypothetical protein
MNIDFYSKYIKYKNKYLILKNKYELKGGASFNKVKNLEPQGANRKLTYLIQDNQGLYHDRLREILNNKGFVELTKQQALSTPDKYVDFFWMGQSNAEGNRFDKDLYQIKSTLVTMLWRDKSHTQGKDAISNKQLLYQNMNKYFPDICSKHMAKTYLLKDIQSLKDINLFENELSNMTTSSEKTSEDSFTKGEYLNKIYIVKPVGHGACAGVGVTVVTNDKELEEARRDLSKRFRNIIVSEYIQNPLLYEDRKFHIRMYILINSDSTWSFWKRGKAMTAKIAYKRDDWTNKAIHDSHGETTPKDIYFPEDILPKEKYEYVYDQIELILGAAANIVKPYVKCYEESKNCCEVFGIDFMITDDYTVKLIEINAEAGYGSKNEDKTKYKAYCSEYFDWFYKESLLSKLFKSSDKIKTYIFTDKEKEIEEEFTKLLDSNGWVRKDINDFPEHVDLLYSRNYKFFYNQLKNKQDFRKIYEIKSNIKSFFWRDDSYKKGKDVVVNKYQLYKNMKKQFPKIADKHMAKTFNILKKDIKIKEGVYIIRPVGKSVGCGEGIEYVTNKKELDDVINKYKNNNKYKKVIASEYINPLLYNNKKFHIRVHILFLNKNGKVTWNTNLHGRILCAKKNFINSDYHNLEIHDTHGKFSTRNIYFPEEFNYGKENTENVLSQMEMILSKVAEIVKPHLKCFTENKNCFEVFGIDFMINSNFTVFLIEVNDDVGSTSFPINNNQENKKWGLFVKEFVKWVYDYGIAPVNDTNTTKLIKSSELINYNNHFEENKEKLHLIYKYYQSKLKNIIEKTSPKKYVKKITWKIPDIKLPIIFNDFNDEKYTLEEFSELFNQYKINFSKFSKIDVSKYIKNIDNEIKDILNFVHSSRYISINIKQWIQNNIDVCYKYNYDHLELFYYTTSKSENLDGTINEINIITKWIYDINPLHKIRLHIFDTPQKKLLTKLKDARYSPGSVSKEFKRKYNLEDKYLGPENVNAGFTSINENKNYRDIFIWRKEDLYSIIIHELFHYLLLDAKFLNDEKYEKLFNNKIKSYLLLNESITEIMSNFFYIIYFSIRKGKNFDDFREMYKKELEFNWYQTAKVLKFFNINSFEINELDRIKSKTAIFSYIIFKSILTTEFCEILFSFPYINKIFNNDETKECNIYRCEPIVNYITKKVNSLPDKDINDLIKNTKIIDESLKRTMFS